MRRLTPQLLAIGLAVAVTACGGGGTDAEVKSTTPGGASSTTSATDDPGSTDDPGTTDTTEAAPDEDFSDSTLTEIPSGEFPEPDLPPEAPESATFSEKIVTDLATALVKFSGRSIATPGGTCTPEINQASPAGDYTCTVDFEGESVDFGIKVTGTSTFINYTGGLSGTTIPLSREKAEWEAAVYAGGDKAVCDMEDFGSLEVGVDGVFTCKALDSTDEVVELKAELIKGGPEGARLSYTRA